MRQRSRLQKDGFTVLELLVVFGIIAMLVSVIAVYLNDARNRARTNRAAEDLRTLVLAVEVLANDTNLLPGKYSADGCVYQTNNNEVFLDTDDGGLVGTGAGYPDWKGPYLSKTPKDSWENPYWFDHDYDCSVGTPRGCEGQPQWVQAVVSSGPNGSALDVYDSDNIVRVRCRP